MKKNMKAVKIGEAIERLRKELEIRVKQENFQDPEVIRLSQQLDELIVEYYKVVNNQDDGHLTGS